MRHLKKGRKIGSDASHGRAIMRVMAAQLFEHGKIKTTLPKAKELRGTVDGIVTLAKRGDVHARRQVLGLINDRALVHKIFTEIAEQFKERNGGYTRIMKLGPRLGDAAPMAVVELVPEAAGSKSSK